MHHRVPGPPAVHYPVHRTPRLKLLLLALWLPGALLPMAMLAFGAASRSPVLMLSVLAALTLSTFGVSAFWRTQRDGILSWDGLHWSLSRSVAGTAPIEFHSIDVHLDVQAALLLRCRVERTAKSVWIWVERQDLPQHWHLLRCAAHGARSIEAEASLGKAAAERI